MPTHSFSQFSCAPFLLFVGQAQGKSGQKPTEFPDFLVFVEDHLSGDRDSEAPVDAAFLEHPQAGHRFRAKSASRSTK